MRFLAVAIVALYSLEALDFQKPHSAMHLRQLVLEIVASPFLILVLDSGGANPCNSPYRIPKLFYPKTIFSTPLPLKQIIPSYSDQIFLIRDSIYWRAYLMLGLAGGEELRLHLNATLNDIAASLCFFIFKFPYMALYTFLRGGI